MKPTREQEAILQAVCDMAARSGSVRRETIKIEAGAGTGKTTMLVMTTKSLKQANPETKILYLAFNKEIKKEAEGKFGDMADCLTVHGIAHRALQIGKTKRPLRRLYRGDVQSVLGSSISGEDVDAILRVMTNFCQSGDSWPSAKHVPERDTRRGGTLGNEQAEWFAEKAGELFMGISPDEPTKANLPFEVYLKYWQMIGAPGLSEYDIVLFDEAQDANPVIMAALEMAGNVVYVGDRHQSIYQFTGAVDAMSLSQGRSLPLTQSFRFGPKMANLANAILNKKHNPPDHPLKGSPYIITRLDDVDRERLHTRIFRTNMMLIREAMVLCDRRMPFSIAGNNDEFVKIIKSIKALINQEHWAVYHPLVKRFKGWDSLRSAAHGDDDSRDLTQAVKIAEEYGDRLDQVIGILSGSLSSSDPRVILTTAHRSKGQEFKQVQLMPDFDDVIDRAAKSPGRWDAEINLLYVACTRAIEVFESRSTYLNSNIMPKLMR